jgi:hypothetical protein
MSGKLIAVVTCYKIMTAEDSTLLCSADSTVRPSVKTPRVAAVSSSCVLELP